MKLLWIIITGLFFSTAVQAEIKGTPADLNAENPYMRSIRRQCILDPLLYCEEMGLNLMRVMFTNDLTYPRRIFMVKPEDVKRAVDFIEEQWLYRPSEFRTSIHKADPANDWISELEFRRNMTQYLQLGCGVLSGTCVYVASKVVKLNSWGLFVYSGCVSQGMVCKVRGDDDITRYNEEIKQIKAACAEGQDDAACLKRVEKGKKAKLLPADNPPPRPTHYTPEDEGTGGDYVPPVGGGDGGWTSDHPVHVCVEHAIGLSGAPKGESVEVETTCYEI